MKTEIRNGERRKEKERKSEDIMLLAPKTEGATSRGMQMASRSLER